jgi:hypothetical protein
MFGEKPISRRHFLKVIGYLGIVSLGGLGALRELYQKQYPSLFSGSSSSVSPASSSQPILQTAFAQTAGSWSLGQNTSVVAIHAALTATGKIIYVAGSSYCINTESGPYQARLLDPTTGNETNVALSNDLFCSGATQLPNGNIFMCGGTKLYDTDVNNCNGSWHGGNYAYEFDITSGTLNQLNPMKQGRWYPTCVTLPSGKVLIVAGDDEYGGYNYLTEIYDPATKSMSVSYNPSSNGTYCVGSGATSTCPGAGTPCYGGPNQGVGPFLALYPRMSLMPSGLVFASGSLQKTYLWDPSSGVWTFVNNTSQTYRDYGASILLPLQNTSNERGKVLIVGGSTSGTTAATNVVEIEDFNQGTSTAPVLRTVASINFARKFLLPIILPNGKVVIFGGSSQGTTNPIYVPEMFDPENEGQGWVTLPAATVPRVYHGTALLLPDGSVWTASSTVNACTTELRTEIFKPSYFSGTRPTISGTPTVGGYGQTITIPTPNPSSISRVSLVRLGATTHHYEANVRLIWLQITGTSSNSITVSAPLSSKLAPPGYYMIHVLDSSLVPSTAQIIQIPGTGGGGGGTAPAQVTGLTVTTPTAPTYVLNLSWTANTETDLNHYNIYRSTTNGFTVNTATDTPVATSTTSSYSDTGLTYSTTYYYVVAAVNNSGLIGPVSSQASGTTVADTTVPMIKITSPANNSTIPNGNILVQGTAGDDPGGSGIKNVLVHVDTGATIIPYAAATPASPGNWSTWSITFNIPTTGSQRIQARATDNAGNQNWNSVTVTLT